MSFRIAMWMKIGHIYTSHWIVLTLLLGYMPTYILSDCKVHPTLVACHRSLPTLEDLINAGPPAHVIISEYNGELYTNINEGYGNFTIRSLQITRSRITGIQPRFFARISNGRLVNLALTALNGSLYLDSETLGGLEDVLQTLYVSDPIIPDVSYLAKMSRLDSVSLIRTGLTELPINFVSLLRRLVKLDLASNKLTSMPWNEVAKRISDVVFSDMKLTQNQWHCDCSMRPIVEAPLEAKRKITNFQCATPQDVAQLSLNALTVGSICPEIIDISKDRPSDSSDLIKPEPGTKGDAAGSREGSDFGSNNRDDQQAIDKARGEDMTLATAGGMSTEVIAVIIAVVAVVVIVLIAVIVFKVRSRDRGRRKHDGDKQPSHKSSAYCSVIEHPNTKPTGRTSGAQNSSGSVPPANSYNREPEDSERQPLAPPYYSRDPRL